VTGLVLGYLAAAGVTLVLGDRVAGGTWLALHLVLLGAATNAIVVWSEHFAAALGVRSAPDGSLTPAKTISFLVGLGAAARVDHYFVQCRRCWVAGCAWRRTPTVAAIHREA